VIIYMTVTWSLVSSHQLHSLALLDLLQSFQSFIRSIRSIRSVYFIRHPPTLFLPVNIIPSFNMKFFAASLLATLAVASPLVVPSGSLDARQFGISSSTSSDLERGTSSNCPKAIFIFARASGEQGNMVCLLLFTNDPNTDVRQRDRPLVPPWPGP
jgi:hypothetical protein